jgi:hypothetical protein
MQGIRGDLKKPVVSEIKAKTFPDGSCQKTSQEKRF